MNILEKNYSITKLKKLVGILLILVIFLGLVPVGFSDPIKKHLEKKIDIHKVQCNNDSNVFVIRTNEHIACVTEKTAEKMGWKMIEINIVSIEKESSLSSNVTQSPTDGFEEIETAKLINNDTKINLETEKDHQRIPNELDTNDYLKEMDEKNILILIFGVILLLISIIVCLFKKWWDS